MPGNIHAAIGGFLLDAFPRTVAQAAEFDRIFANEEIQLDAVLSDDLSIEEVVTRSSGRRTCAQCKAVFHVIGRPPKPAGVCDVLNQTIPISSCSASG